MVFKLKGDVVTINIFDLLHEYLPDNRKEELAESLTCADVVIKNVMDQVLDGYTENNFSGSESLGHKEDSLSPLEKARVRIAKNSGKMAEKEINRLCGLLTRMEDQKNEYMDKYFELYHQGY